VSADEISRAGAVLPGASFGTFRLPADVAIVVERAQGANLWDTDGREYVDYVLGSGPMLVGHAHPHVLDRLREQLASGTQYYTLNRPAIELAERIVELVPCAEMVKFVSTGAEATFFALRLARALTGRATVLKFEGGYHGAHDYGLQSVTPPEPSEYPAGRPESAGIPGATSGTVVVAPFNDLDRTRAIAERCAEDLAAIIVEPVQRSIEPVPGFLEGLRDLCTRLGAVLVFDEVVTGFRLAPGGAQEAFGVVPDLCALGKVIGGGLPLGAVAGRREIMELTDQEKAGARWVYLSGTLNGNPLAATAGLATIEVLLEPESYPRLRAYGSALADGLREIGRRLSVPLQVIGPPAFGEPVITEGPVRDWASYAGGDRRASRTFGVEMVRRGVFVNPSAKLYVSTAHGERHLDYTLETASEALAAVRERGLLG
jgi:glutamate-1-semialdehyde 2,1-aminomutase